MCVYNKRIVLSPISNSIWKRNIAAQVKPCTRFSLAIQRSRETQGQKPFVPFVRFVVCTINWKWKRGNDGSPWEPSSFSSSSSSFFLFLHRYRPKLVVVNASLSYSSTLKTKASKQKLNKTSINKKTVGPTQTFLALASPAIFNVQINNYFQTQKKSEQNHKNHKEKPKELFDKCFSFSLLFGGDYSNWFPLLFLLAGPLRFSLLSAWEGLAFCVLENGERLKSKTIKLACSQPHKVEKKVSQPRGETKKEKNPFNQPTNHGKAKKQWGTHILAHTQTISNSWFNFDRFLPLAFVSVRPYVLYE